MKRKFRFLLIAYLFILIGCSRSNGSTHPVSYVANHSDHKPVETVIAALNTLQDKNISKYHEFTAFQMATDYTASYIATDPFASSPFENFLILHYLAAIVNNSTYEILEVQQVNEDATVAVKMTIPNYTELLELSLPDVISVYRQHYASTNVEDFNAKTSLMTTMNEMINNSCEDLDSTEMINTFKLKNIEGSWYIVDNGLLYDEISQFVQFYNRQL